MDGKLNFRSSSLIGCGGMKRSDSQLAFEEYLASQEDRKGHRSRAEIFGGPDSCHALSASENQEIRSTSLVGDPFWSQNFYSKQSNFSVQIDSQSSIGVESPISTNTPKGDDRAVGASSGYSHEQSDEDDPETEAGSCEQITNPTDIKRIKRMVSNRQSARRSRRRKQEHLADLEQQVELLRAESESLSKELEDAALQFKESNINNRVLRSDVEALRAKVKLAEDMVSHGSLTLSWSHLLQNYLNSPHEYTNNSMTHIDHNIPQIIAPHGEHTSPYTGISESAMGIEHYEAAFNGHVSNGAVAADLQPEVWALESIVAPSVSK